LLLESITFQYNFASLVQKQKELPLTVTA